MSRYIDADKIEYTARYVGMDEFAGWQTIAFKSDIDKIPTADVVEVVRCKDCKYSEHCYDDVFDCRCPYTPFATDEYSIPCNGNDYCSYGERSEG